MTETTIDWKESLDEILCNGESREATNIFLSLTGKKQQEFITYRHRCFCDFSEVGNWENGKAPTRKQIAEDLWYLIDLGRKL